GELQMNSKLTKLAAAGALSLCTAVPALAGSVTQPGETVGLNAGAPLPPGWYAINTVDWGCRNTTPTHTCTGLTIPVVAWSTPWTFFGREISAPGGVARGRSRRATKSKRQPRPQFARHLF